MLTDVEFGTEQRGQHALTNRPCPLDSSAAAAQWLLIESLDRARGNFGGRDGAASSWLNLPALPVAPWRWLRTQRGDLLQRLEPAPVLWSDQLLASASVGHRRLADPESRASDRAPAFVPARRMAGSFGFCFHGGIYNR